GRLQRAGLWRVPAVLVVTTVAFLIVAGFGAIVVQQAHGLATELPRYRDNIRQKLTALQAGGNGVWADVENAFNELHEAFFGRPDRPMTVQVKPSGAAQLEAVVGPMVDLLAHLVLVLFLVVFMLVKREDLRNRVIRLVGHGHVTETTHAL